LDPTFKQFTFQEKIKAVCKSLSMKKPVVPQSMYIFKQPGIGGEVAPHQDSTFLHTDPMKLIGFWIPLEDATEENGCLWFIPGSQTDGITRRFIRNPSGVTPPTLFTGPAITYEDGKFVAAPAKKGSLVLIHGEVVHRSLANRSDKSRQVYTFHVMETDNTTYSTENWYM
jgi:ectoine hydroxylase-related dioxygenase (phytanoyl-CoA dioxygenase family)